MRQSKSLWKILIILALQAVFFSILFFADNKYETPPPYGKSGVIEIDGQDLLRENPIFLIDGWLLTDARVSDKPVYIGEFSNLQRGDMSVSPHGSASYRLTLRYKGEVLPVSVDFPRLSSEYKIFQNGVKLAEGEGNGRITFLMTPGDHTITVETLSKIGYYSGMYFPPALGRSETLSRLDNIRNFFYALAFLLPVSMSAFTLFLWRTGGRMSRFFGMLCCFYALYMFRYFVFLFSMSAARYWFLVQGAALYGLCFCVIQLMALASGGAGERAWKWMRRVLVILPVVLTVLCLLIPFVPSAVFVHGRLTDLYYLLAFGCTVFYMAKGMSETNWESRYTLAGGAVFGVGIMLNLLFSNDFEPIRFFWQFEWCGLFLVLLFGAMMVSRNRRVLKENRALTNHLEELVKKRTEEITLLLEERKAFFSDMAHDLKAPVFATQSFIEAIRQSGVGVDPELRGYLDQAEARQLEMARRLQGLSNVNALDKIEEEWVRVSVSELLTELNAVYRGEAKVRAIHFMVEMPAEDLFLSAQPEKLNILFENLIYNAFRATPREGIIKVSAVTEDNQIRLTVEDTGCGIPENEIPFIFKRFYIGEGNRENGTGLGLYIVHSIVTEMRGTIRVYSTVGEGTKFVMDFPVAYSR